MKHVGITKFAVGLIGQEMLLLKTDKQFGFQKKRSGTAMCVAQYVSPNPTGYAHLTFCIQGCEQNDEI